jgi:hypothetical protein
MAKSKKTTLLQEAAKAARLYVRPSCVMKVGIDYSYKSPSWSIFDGNEYFSYFIAQRVREEGVHFTLKSAATHAPLSVHVAAALGMMPKEVSAVDRNHRLATIVLKTIEHHRNTRVLRTDQVHCAIERSAYGYGKVGMSSMSDLQECAGVLKNYLFRADYAHVDEISPGSIKKLWTTKGNAGKPQMLQQYMHRYGLPDPCSALAFAECVDFTDSDLRKVPKPVEDLVDSLALVAVIDPKLANMGVDIPLPPTLPLPSLHAAADADDDDDAVVAASASASASTAPEPTPPTTPTTPTTPTSATDAVAVADADADADADAYAMPPPPPQSRKRQCKRNLVDDSTSQKRRRTK